MNKSRAPKNTSQPLVSIIILNWNGIEDTLNCLKSLEKLDYSNYEVIVVDNGSVDGSKKVLSTTRNITYVDNPQNAGFTGGHIIGQKHAKGEYIFILNNDTVVAPEYLKEAVKLLEKDTSIGAVGGRSYRLKSVQDEYDTSLPFYSYQKINLFTGEGIFKQHDDGRVIEVNNISGSAAVIRHSTIKSVGYFYSPFFAYYEETDLFARMKRAGHKVVYSPNLHIWHKDGSSSSSYFQYKQLYRNRLLFVLRNFDKNLLPKFLKNYCYVGARYSLSLIKSKNRRSDFIRGSSAGFFKGLLMIPNALWSRRSIDIDSVSRYVDFLAAEESGLAVVFDFSKKNGNEVAASIEKCEKVLDALSFNIDFIYCIKSKSGIKSKQLIKTGKVVEVTEGFLDTSMNIGWLSSSAQYLTFTNDNLSENDVKNRLKMAAKLQTHSGLLVSSDVLFESVVSRELLIKFGELTYDQHKFAELGYFSKLWSSKKTIGYNENTLNRLLSQNDLKQVASNVKTLKHLDRSPNFINKIFLKYSRLEQLRKTAVWYLSLKVRLRTKVARTRNILLAAVKLDRKTIATELRHIRNDIIKMNTYGVNVLEQNKVIKKSFNKLLNTKDYANIPIFIICRDRLNGLKELVYWLEKHGLNRIVLIDNDSVYPPLVRYLQETPHQVIFTSSNIGHTVPWSGGVVKTLAKESPYIVTDPDIIPDKECPADVMEKFIKLHLEHVPYQKVGFSLLINDLPDSFILKQSVVDWESQFWTKEVEQGVFEAPLDTTFALYKPFTYTYFLSPSLRTGPPYAARHLPWYKDSEKETGEDIFYKERADGKITSWNVDSLPERYAKELSK